MTALRLRHVAAVNPPTPEFERASDDAMVTFVPLEAVWPNALDVTRQRPKHEVAQGYTRFREGDVLVPKITPTFEADRSTIARNLVNGFGAGTTELHVVRCGPHVDRRYVNYLVSSRRFLTQGEAEMIGVAGQKRVPDTCLRNLPVPVHDAVEQRTIADRLNTEAARIDALIARKRRMLELLDERWQVLVDTHVQDSGPSVSLRHLVSRLTSGPRGWSERTGESGEPFVRITNISRKSIELDRADLLRVDDPLTAEAERTRIANGDVLVPSLPSAARGSSSTLTAS